MFVCDLQGCEILRQTHGAGHGQESQSHHLVRHRNWEIAGLCKNTLWDFQARVWCQGKNDGLIEPHIIDWHLCVILKTLPVHPRSVPPVDLHVNIDVNKMTKNIDARHVYLHIPLWFHNQNLSSNSRLQISEWESHFHTKAYYARAYADVSFATISFAPVP